MINKIKENKHLRAVLIIISAIILGAGVSFAFYAAIINGNETSTTLTLEAGTLSINYDGGDEILAKGFLPGSDPFATKTFTLTGNNDSELYMPYTISLVVDLNTFNAGSLKCKLSGNNDSNNGGIALTSTKFIHDNIIELGKGYFAPNASNATHTYRVDFYFPDDGTDQSDEMKSRFQAHIKIEGAKISQDVPSTGEDSTLIAGSIASTIVGGTDFSNVNTSGNVTKPGEASSGTEGLLSTQDDFGTSYYFRGKADNNYVYLNEMCWRIVRIMGDGNIKLTLHSLTGDCLNDEGLGAFIGDPTYYYNGSDSTPLFTETNAYQKLVEFYEHSLTDRTKSKMVDSIWCSDYSTEGSNYGPDVRMTNNPPTPSLICPDGPSADPNLYRYSLAGGDLSNGNKLMTYSIGLLTLDELLFAGASQYYTPASLYIQQGSYAGLWATMSPGLDDGSLHIEFVWDTDAENSNGNGIDPISYAASESVFYIRPTIVISGKLDYDFGDGTASDPYYLDNE